MPTIKQRKVAKLIIENAKLDKPLNGGEIVESSGYGETMKLYPKRVIETEGVKEALNDYGFNEDNAKRVVAEILLNPKEKAEARLKATDQVFKVHSTYAPDKSVNVNINKDIVAESDIQKMAEEIAQKLKEKKLNELQS